MDTKIPIISKMLDTDTQIYILYNYELYKLIIKVFKHVSIFFILKMFLITRSKGFIHYFCNHDKNLYNKFEFLKN